MQMDEYIGSYVMLKAERPIRTGRKKYKLIFMRGMASLGSWMISLHILVLWAVTSGKFLSRCFSLFLCNKDQGRRYLGFWRLGELKLAESNICCIPNSKYSIILCILRKAVVRRDNEWLWDIVLYNYAIIYIGVILALFLLNIFCHLVSKAKIFVVRALIIFHFCDLFPPKYFSKLSKK